MSSPATVSSTKTITRAWLNEKLKASGKLKTEITDMTLEPIGAGVGLMGELGRLKLTYAGEESLPPTMIVKCAAQNENIEVARILDFYNREVNFYNKIGGESGLRTPESYYGAVDQESYDHVILMEDLGAVSPNDQVVGASEDEAFAAIEHLATMHGKYWGKVSGPESSWMFPVHSEPEAVKLQQMVYGPAMEPVLEKFPDFFNDQTREVIRTVGARYPDYWCHKLSPVETFVHGDYRQDNFIYEPGNLNAIVMDWQISGKGRGIFDFAYFVCQSLQPDLRRAIEEELLKLYVSRLEEAGVKDYSFEQAFQDYRIVVLGCLVYPVTVGGSLDLANERGKALAECMLERNLVAVEELNSVEFL